MATSHPKSRHRRRQESPTLKIGAGTAQVFRHKEVLRGVDLDVRAASRW